MEVIDGPDYIKLLEGKVLCSPWLDVDQQRLNDFANCTGDRQWIHTDPERAATGPYQRTIAHGYLILALIPYFWKQSCQLPDIRMTLNYGLNRVRFPAPVSVGTRIRARFHIVEVSPVDGGTQARFVVTIERENQEKPACVAEVLTRFCT